MYDHESDFLLFLDCLKAARCLNDVMIIGSWAEYVYQRSSLLDGFEPEMKTTDADILIRNLRRPPEPVNIVKIAKEKGFEYREDYQTGCSKLFKGDEFEVQFLISQRGDGNTKLPRTNIGVNAEQLTHLDVLKDFPIICVVNETAFIVPAPEAYILQKMIINHERKEKKARDQKKIDSLLPFADRNKLRLIFDSLSKKERKFVDAYIKEVYSQDLETFFEGREEFVISEAVEKMMDDIRNISRRIVSTNNEIELQKYRSTSAKILSKIIDGLKHDNPRANEEKIIAFLSKVGLVGHDGNNTTGSVSRKPSFVDTPVEDRVVRPIKTVGKEENKERDVPTNGRGSRRGNR